MTLPRIILADDHKKVIEAFSKLLEPHCNVVATVSDELTPGKSAYRTSCGFQP
jgi:hypothetical protein